MIQLYRHISSIYIHFKFIHEYRVKLFFFKYEIYLKDTPCLKMKNIIHSENQEYILLLIFSCDY